MGTPKKLEISATSQAESLGVEVGSETPLIAAENASDDLYDIMELTAPPRALFQKAPVYPSELEEEGIEGHSVVEFVIAKDGVVIDAKSIQSTHVAFEESSVDAVFLSKWKPGEIDGKAVNCRVRQKIVVNIFALVLPSRSKLSTPSTADKPRRGITTIQPFGLRGLMNRKIVSRSKLRGMKPYCDSN